MDNMVDSGKKSTMQAFAPALADIAEVYDDLVLLEADSGSSTGGRNFAESFPERYYNVGMAEQNLILAAAGFALTGRRVFVSSFSSFLVGRAYDHIRNSVAIPSLSMRIVGTNGGVTEGESGATYQMLEDISLMRALPNMTVMVPSDYLSAYRLLRSAGERENPVYIRLGSLPVPSIYPMADDDFLPGEGRLLVEGTGVTICACGIMVHEALKAANILSQQELSAEVIDCYSVKPLPSRVILASVRRTGCCVVAEEHTCRGGLGEAVASLVSRSYPVPVKFVSVEDRFGQSGTPEELQEYYGLTESEIVSAAVQAWTMRRR